MTYWHAIQRSIWLLRYTTQDEGMLDKNILLHEHDIWHCSLIFLSLLMATVRRNHYCSDHKPYRDQSNYSGGVHLEEGSVRPNELLLEHDTGHCSMISWIYPLTSLHWGSGANSGHPPRKRSCGKANLSIIIFLSPYFPHPWRILLPFNFKTVILQEVWWYHIDKTRWRWNSSMIRILITKSDGIIYLI